MCQCYLSLESLLSTSRNNLPMDCLISEGGQPGYVFIGQEEGRRRKSSKQRNPSKKIPSYEGGVFLGGPETRQCLVALETYPGQPGKDSCF